MQQNTQLDSSKNRTEHRDPASGSVLGSEIRPAPLMEWYKLADVARRNRHLFKSYSALYYFVEQHQPELLARRILARQGRGRRSPILLCEGLLLEYFVSCAEGSS